MFYGNIIWMNRLGEKCLGNYLQEWNSHKRSHFENFLGRQSFIVVLVIDIHKNVWCAIDNICQWKTSLASLAGKWQTGKCNLCRYICCVKILAISVQCGEKWWNIQFYLENGYTAHLICNIEPQIWFLIEITMVRCLNKIFFY